MPLIQIMSGLGCLRAFGGTAVALFWGMGAPRYAMKYSMVQTGGAGGSDRPSGQLVGLEGVAAAVLLSYLTLEALYAFRLLSLLGAGWVHFVRVMAVPLIASLGMVVVIGSVKGIVGAGIAGFGTLVVVGAGSYVGFLLILDSMFMASQTRGMIADIFSTARGPLAE